ncbi:MAG: hypothetical protein NTY38_21620, partial [Acidobacteria bacterium]|nr:hypothetical protein [Acidobacteriota bacterium]
MKVEVHRPGPAQQPEFLMQWAESRDRGRVFRAGVISLALHVVGAIILLTTPLGQVVIPRTRTAFLRPIPLVAPPKEITQTAPNKGHISKEFDVASLMPRPAVPSAPASPPRMQTPLPPMPAPTRSAPPEASKAAPVPEPPKLETARAQPPPTPAAQGSP